MPYFQLAPGKGSGYCLLAMISEVTKLPLFVFLLARQHTGLQLELAVTPNRDEVSRFAQKRAHAAVTP